MVVNNLAKLFLEVVEVVSEVPHGSEFPHSTGRQNEMTYIYNNNGISLSLPFLRMTH